ncbi:hypothetical protein ACIQBJ_00155 [Kitasatospora sp. NPDC088391]|uniref:hypothetical protein n=1 Tax=Kitasatospora sp. NPDC088391 TaxID=3364074 RepID=UPI00381F798B
MSSSSYARVLGIGLNALVPTGSAAAPAPEAPPAAVPAPAAPAAAGRRAADRLLQLRTVEVPVPVAAAAAELLALLLDHPDPVTRETARTVQGRLRMAARIAGTVL